MLHILLILRVLGSGEGVWGREATVVTACIPALGRPKKKHILMVSSVLGSLILAGGYANCSGADCF